MRTFFLTLVASFFSCLSLSAQSEFLRSLESEVEGQGVIVVNQDPRLAEILNGEVEIPSVLSTTSKVASITTESKVKQDTDNLSGKMSGLHQKVRGYRVQVYFGGNQRSNQTQAQRAGSRVTAAFPELRSYVKFDSPHWHCRVGDFTNYDDASAYMRKIKAKGFAEAMVVKSEIYVSTEQLNNYNNQ